MTTPDEWNIRKLWFKGEWYYSIVDIVGELLEKNTREASTYWRKLKSRLIAEGNETVTKCHKLKLVAEDGKMRLTDVVNTEQSLRLIQSIPSPKAEPMKLWLAGVGAERLEETADSEGYEERIILENLPDNELARRKRQERRIQTYKDMGRDDAWITVREWGIVTRRLFTAVIKEYMGSKVNYGQITNDVYRGVHHRDANQLRADLGIQSHQNPRDFMERIGLYYVGIAEEACNIKLAHLRLEDAVPPKLVREIIILISKQVGLQADDMALALGIDLVTGKPLLSDVPNVYSKRQLPG